MVEDEQRSPGTEIDDEGRNLTQQRIDGELEDPRPAGDPAPEDAGEDEMDAV